MNALCDFILNVFVKYVQKLAHTYVQPFFHNYKLKYILMTLLDGFIETPCMNISKTIGATTNFLKKKNVYIYTLHIVYI